MRLGRLVFSFCFCACAAALAGCVRFNDVRWAESSAPGVRVNQVGYLPNGPKWATLRSTSSSPVEVELVQGPRVLWKGRSQPFGYDDASGDSVHWIDFSSFSDSASAVVLETSDTTSLAFDVRSDIYDQLAFDALKYFYHNRSGIPIVEPFVDQTYSRPAGHESDVYVACWLEDQCQYALDVSGGWYDAGDHGKYVVNGGISAWTLLSLYERLVHLSHTAAAWADGSLNIPESHNGVPDLLDEARYEVEFLLRMQVPAGQPLEGMVHHKVHDNGWTPLAIEPAPRTDQRALHPPSTAATLNMAAVAAQAARVFAPLDPRFSARCLLGAQTAFAAALRHPDIFAPALDKIGGGPYDDVYVGDEFFWAAAELFLATGEHKYFDHLRKSPHFDSFSTVLIAPDGRLDGDGVSSSMSWQMTAGLGSISLAVVGGALPGEEQARLRQNIVSAGAAYLEAIEHEGYRLPLTLGPNKKYPWGSNFFRPQQHARPRLGLRLFS